jgi:hypothetical protein
MDGRLDADIVAVSSNIKGGGVSLRLDKMRSQGMDIPFEYAPKNIRTPEWHESLVHKYGGNCWIALSGCLWLVPMKEHPYAPEPGLDPRYVFNIHPAPLSVVNRAGKQVFGGEGLFGDHVHQAVFNAYKQGLVRRSAVAMHFVTKKYDEGPLFFEWPVPILYEDWERMRTAVNQLEHYVQPWVTNLVVTGHISWDGRNQSSLTIPSGYDFIPIPETLTV